jgi:peptidoglycan hydrolase-like protein with peptidoglycan-binding domain
MSTNDDLLRKILLNMSYDSRKTLTENILELPSVLNEQYNFPKPNQILFQQSMLRRGSGEQCTGEGMYGFCDYGYCNIMMPSTGTKGTWFGIGNLFNDGYYYLRRVADNGQWSWYRVPKNTNMNYDPYKYMDPNFGLIINSESCSSQTCRDTWKKIEGWKRYVSSELKKKCQGVFTSEENLLKLNKDKVLKLGDNDKILKLPYVYRLQQVLSNLQEIEGGSNIVPDGIFGNNTLSLVKKFFNKNTVSIKEVEASLSSKTGGAAAPYPEYFSYVGRLKRLGWKNTTCTNCKTAAEHLDICAFYEMKDINDEMLKYVNIPLGCQFITTDKGTNGVEIPNYGVNDIARLVRTKEGVKSGTIANQNILGGGVANSNQIKQIQKSMLRPYFTYFALRDFYLMIGKIQPDLKKTKGGFFDRSIWPDGPYKFMINFYQTESRNDINSLINTFKPAIKATSCNDMDSGIGEVDAYSGGIKFWEFDPHSVTTAIEIGSLILGLIPTPLSPLLLGISTAAGLADAGLYFAEGDPYMGSMMLALEIIPGGELFSVLKKGKTTAKLGVDGTKEILQKGLKNELQDQLAQQTYKNLTQELQGVVGKEIAQKAEANIVLRATTKMADGFAKLPFKQQLKAFSNIVELCWNSIGKIPQIILKVGGTAITVDQLYLAINGRDESRQNSDIRRMYYWLKGYEGLTPEEKGQMIQQEELQREMQKAVVGVENAMKSADKKQIADATIKVSTGFDQSALDAYLIKRVNETKQLKTKDGIVTLGEVQIPMPSEEDVKTGKAFYSLGMSGDTIGQIKKQLKNNWGVTFSEGNYDLSGLNENPNSFDVPLLSAVIALQDQIIPKKLKKKLPENEPPGVIGPETLKVIRTIPEDMKIQTKKVTPYDLQKDQFNYFFYSARLDQWKPITYEQYQDYYNQGYDKKLKAVRKQQQEPTLLNPSQQQTTQRRGLFRRNDR